MLSIFGNCHKIGNYRIEESTLGIIFKEQFKITILLARSGSETINSGYGKKLRDSQHLLVVTYNTRTGNSEFASA